MSETNEDNFLFLNVDGKWPNFNHKGLELRPDGALQLHSLPLLISPAETSSTSIPDGPSGIAVDVDGTIYFTDPKNHRLFKIDACDDSICRLSCIGGEGSKPTQLNTPRGLLIPDYRHSLFLADSGNHRVQVFDIDSWQLGGVWGQSSMAAEPQASSDAGRFNTPWSLAADHHGNVYVVDYENRRVQRFNRTGDVKPSFWEQMANAKILKRPSGIAVHDDQRALRIYVIDETLHSVFVFYGNGSPVLGRSSKPVSIGSMQLKKPMGIAATRDAIYVGDNERQRVLKFRTGDFEFIGEAVGYRGPVAALALDRKGNLLVHSGGCAAPVRLAIEKGFLTRGVLWSKAIKASEAPVNWHRVQATTNALPSGAHLRLFVHTSDDRSAPPVVNPDIADPFSDPKWRPQSSTPDPFSGVKDLFIGGRPAEFLWVGVLFSGDGRSTPVVPQLRVEFDHQTYLNHLPAIFREDIFVDKNHPPLHAGITGIPGNGCAKSLLGHIPDHQICVATGSCCCGDFLLRFISLFETFFTELEDRIAILSLLFDPRVIPKEFLPWLAGWLALDLDEDWDEARQRRLIAKAFELYGRRGTVEGLRESLRLFAGVNAIIEEPIINAAWWSLPAEAATCNCGKSTPRAKQKQWQSTENSILGVNTMLAPAHPQGAVVGSTATLDHSHLITNEEFGAPLFDDVAHQFSVQLYRSQLQCTQTLPKVHAVIEAEKPAHTGYHLCIIEPHMRVHFQARLGIDTVVAGPPLETRLREGMSLGGDNPLAGQSPGSVGKDNRLGTTTRVG
ncbi:MAG: phage tail protein I [Pyrinomonadaceae bacterium]|nr:phage tail protein I [Pyrinomonadaceae bacterium]